MFEIQVSRIAMSIPMNTEILYTSLLLSISPVWAELVYRFLVYFGRRFHRVRLISGTRYSSIIRASSVLDAVDNISMFQSILTASQHSFPQISTNLIPVLDNKKSALKLNNLKNSVAQHAKESRLLHNLWVQVSSYYGNEWTSLQKILLHHLCRIASPIEISSLPLEMKEEPRRTR